MSAAARLRDTSGPGAVDKTLDTTRAQCARHAIALYELADGRLLAVRVGPAGFARELVDVGAVRVLLRQLGLVDA